MSDEKPTAVEPAPKVAVRRRLTESDMKRSGLPRRYWRATFEEIQAGEHRDVVRRYLESLPKMIDDGYGLLLWGVNGVGKTSIGAVIAKEALRQHRSAYFIRAADYRDAVFSKKMFDDYESVRERAYVVDLLIVDDLGKEGPDQKGYAEALYEDVVRSRTAERKSLILTTNLSQEDFIDPKKGGYRESMVAVLTDSVLPVQVDGGDLRVREAERLATLLGGDQP